MNVAEATEHLREFFAQRDGAREGCDLEEAAYWRGYIDCVCDTEGIDADLRAAAESAYQQIQAFASESMKVVASDARRRSRP